MAFKVLQQLTQVVRTNVITLPWPRLHFLEYHHPYLKNIRKQYNFLNWEKNNAWISKFKCRSRSWLILSRFKTALTLPRLGLPAPASILTGIGILGANALCSSNIIFSNVRVAIGIDVQGSQDPSLCSSIVSIETFLTACRLGVVSEVSRLIQLGMKVDSRHELGWSALHVAAVNKRSEVVKILLEAGADPNVLDQFSTVTLKSREKQLNALHVLLTREEEFSDRLSNRANFQNCTPLHYAVLVNDMECVKLLLEADSESTPHSMRFNTKYHCITVMVEIR
ncbi:caseinolytic peptidase b protein homolog [Plakobranchus ocellatus]|uniref:Caseinolytic peptidase b protein homolog n=1 Tax=Plakobranchus ocellatus TaxID=259542 RepID=A0AAV3YXA9_9GAST|nr:caseinolytic peptidase b protein homolog [Plakobranchus ocellatus]